MAGAPVVVALSSCTAPVHINVGGTSYTSSLETLTRFPHSKLAKYFNGSLPIVVDPEQRKFFFDRDGKTFRHVLNFLRNSKLILPDNFGEINLLLEEAIYFEIEDLRQNIQQFLDDKMQGYEETEDTSCSEEENMNQCAKKNKKKRSKKKRHLEKTNEAIQDTSGEMGANSKDNGEFSKTAEGKSFEVADLCGTNTCRSAVENTEQNHKVDKNQCDRKVLFEHITLGDSSTEDKVILDGNLKTDRTLLTDRDNELVYVITDTDGGVKELWCSDADFNFEFPLTFELACVLKVRKCSATNNFLFSHRFIIEWQFRCCKCLVKKDNAQQFSSQINFLGKNGRVVCGRCWSMHIIDKEFESSIIFRTSEVKVGFPGVVKHLFSQRYKLVTSVSVASDRQILLHHCFVK